RPHDTSPQHAKPEAVASYEVSATLCVLVCFRVSLCCRVSGESHARAFSHFVRNITPPPIFKIDFFAAKTYPPLQMCTWTQYPPPVHRKMCVGGVGCTQT
ncbi:unnamed protein product, partial [Ectocarpus sp. 12 AP-2014]